MQNKKLRSVIVASSLGTLIEWYDFYIFGSLAMVISTKFFPQTNPTAAFLSTLATFAAGFVVRPFGALVFGRLGDMIGRKYTFMVTLMLMGGSTFLIGCIPSYETIGFLAPLLVLILRLLQGLALGGEYGGAATYVAEHAPDNKKGYGIPNMRIAYLDLNMQREIRNAKRILTEKNIKLYPNPITSSAKIAYKSTNDGLLNWKMINSVGQLIKSGQLPVKKEDYYIIELGNLALVPRGKYFLVYQNGDEHGVLPFIK